MADDVDKANEYAADDIGHAVQRARDEANRQRNPHAVSNTHCDECGDQIPEGRRQAVSGCELCAECKEELEWVFKR